LSIHSEASYATIRELSAANQNYAAQAPKTINDRDVGYITVNY